MQCLHIPIPRPKNISFCSHHIIINKPLSLSTSCNDFAESCKPTSSLSKFRLAKCGAPRIDKLEKHQFQLTLEAELMPKHVAVIMDGNRRWAKNRGLPVPLGHRAGGKAMKQLALNCRKYGVKVVSVFAFSTENWVRPEEEVNFLMNLFEEVIASDFKELMGYDMRLTFLGNRSRLPESLQKLICAAEERCETNKGLHLVIAMNYSGQYDIIEATKEIATKVKDGVLQVEDINHTIFEQHLETNGIEFPKPDLLIRTSGELRVSNYMLWQLAYTELFFTNKLFPDFDEADLVEALTAFQGRQRRYGGHKY